MNSSSGREYSTKITSSRFTENCISFYGQVVCRQIAYCFSRILTVGFNGSLLCNLCVAIFSLPNFTWVASIASSTVVHYQSVLHIRVRKADFSSGI